MVPVVSTPTGMIRAFTPTRVRTRRGGRARLTGSR
jgi:hypothetical protein